jgi:hypothetical protein
MKLNILFYLFLLPLFALLRKHKSILFLNYKMDFIITTNIFIIIFILFYFSSHY